MTIRHGPATAASYRTRSIVYYLAVTGLLVLIVINALPILLPDSIATQIGHNSEALLFAIGFSAIVQFLLPWIHSRGWTPWRVTVPAAIACIAFGAALLQAPWPPTLVTLNEPMIAIGLMLLYVSIRRPFRRAPIVSALVLVVLAVFFNTSVVLGQAESLIPLLLAPFALDVFDRAILEPGSADRPVLRLVWMAFLLVVAVTLIFASRWVGDDVHGPFRSAINYAQRGAEAYWGWLIVAGYFGIWIGRARGWTGRHAHSWSASVTTGAGVR